MDKELSKAKAIDSQRDKTVNGNHTRVRRKPAGRKPHAIIPVPPIADLLTATLNHCWPKFNIWLNDIDDPRSAPMCRYTSAHIWWEIILTFLTRGGSRNAFDVDRNTGFMPQNIANICGQEWDEEILGTEKTVTCSENAVHHADRVAAGETETILVKMVRRLINMRMLDSARLFGSWWMIAVDATLQQRTGRMGQKKSRMVLEARLIGPCGIELPLMVEFLDVDDPVREKRDCELKGFDRLSKRLHAEFPRLPICLLLDGLYAVEPVFQRCKDYGWKFIATMKEGRQPTAFNEAIQIMMMNPDNITKTQRKNDDGLVEQDIRWAEQVPVSGHSLNVIFSGEISVHSATLWVWVTNLSISATRIATIVNDGGHARFRQEENFNVLKNNGYGLEHAFCTKNNASKNYHIMLLVADTIWQLLADGVLCRLKVLARKLTDISLVRHLFAGLVYVPIAAKPVPIGQIRFSPG
jgi:hypothetical protein